MSKTPVIGLLCFLAVSNLFGSSAKPMAPEMERDAKDVPRKDCWTRIDKCCFAFFTELSLAICAGHAGSFEEYRERLKVWEQQYPSPNPQLFFNEISRRRNDAKKNQ